MIGISDSFHDEMFSGVSEMGDQFLFEPSSEEWERI